MMKAINANQVAKRLYREEVNEMNTERTGCAPGSSGWIAGYSATLLEFMKRFSDEEMEEFRVKAEEWNESGPPDQVKQE
jgi:hypothetical protein